MVYGCGLDLMTQDVVHWWTFVDTIMRLRVNFLNGWATVCSLRQS